MKKYVFLLLAFVSAGLQSSCGKSNQMINPAAKKLQDTINIISVNESKNLNIIPDYGESDLPKDKLQIICRYIGSDFVGKPVSLDKSGISSANGLTNMVINTKDLESKGLYKPITGGGPHIWINKNFNKEVWPWSTDKGELVMQMYAEVPSVTLTDLEGKTASYGFAADKSPVTQLSFGVYLKDRVSKKVFAYIICVYESRGTYQESAKNNDTFTNFTSTPLEESSKYISKSPLSVSLQSRPFSEKKFFKMHINRENLMKAIRDTKDGMSDNPADYQITMAGVLFELPNHVSGGHNTSEVKVSELSAFIQKN